MKQYELNLIFAKPLIAIAGTKLCNYGVMTRELVEGFVYFFRCGLDCSAESVF